MKIQHLQTITSNSFWLFVWTGSHWYTEQYTFIKVPSMFKQCLKYNHPEIQFDPFNSSLSAWSEPVILYMQPAWVPYGYTFRGNKNLEPLHHRSQLKFESQHQWRVNLSILHVEITSTFTSHRKSSTLYPGNVKSIGWPPPTVSTLRCSRFSSSVNPSQ